MWAVLYERGESRKNFSPVGDQELFLRPPALNLPASHAGMTQAELFANARQGHRSGLFLFKHDGDSLKS